MTAATSLDDLSVMAEIARRLPAPEAAACALALRRYRSLWQAAHHAATLDAWLTWARRDPAAVTWHPTHAALASLAAALRLLDGAQAQAWLEGPGRPLADAALHTLLPSEYAPPLELPVAAVDAGLAQLGPDGPEFVHTLLRDLSAAVALYRDPAAVHAVAIELPPAARADLLLHACELGGLQFTAVLLDPTSAFALPTAHFVQLAAATSDQDAFLAALPAACLGELAHGLYAAGAEERAARTARAALDHMGAAPAGATQGNFAQAAYFAGVMAERGALQHIAGNSGAATASLAQSATALCGLHGALARQAGDAHLLHGDAEAALDAYRDALGHDAEDAGARAGAAAALNALGRAADALAVLGERTDAVTKHADAAWEGARAYQVLGQAERAGRAFENALDLIAHDTRPPAIAQDEAALLAMATALPLPAVTSTLAAAATGASSAHPGLPALLSLAAHIHARAQDWPQARDAWTQLAALRPADASAQLALGRCALNDDDPEAAARHFQTALALAPDDPAVHQACGEVALARGEMRTAQTSAEKAVALAPQSSAARTLLGRVLLAARQYDSACSQLTQATSLQPAYAPAWQTLAEVHRQSGRYQRALAILEAGQQAAPEDPDLQAAGAHVLLELDRPTEALTAFEHAERLAAGHAPRHAERANWAVARAGLLQKLGYPDQALELLADAAKFAGAGAPVFREFGRALMQAGRSDEAVTAARRAIALVEGRRPVPPGVAHDSLLVASRLLTQAGEATEAIAVLRRATARGLNSADMYLALGEAYERTSEPQLALDAYRSAGHIAPGDATVQHRIGAACRSLGHLDAALVALREASVARPHDLSILADLGVTLTAAGFPAEAVDVWSEIAQRRPDDGPTLVSLGSAQRRNGDSATGLITLRHARRLVPGDPRACYELALAADCAGETEEAVAALQEMTALAPNQPAYLRDAGQKLLALGQAEAAMPALERAVTLDPQDPAAHEAYGSALVHTGRARLALAEIEAAHRLEPANPGHCRALAEVLWSLGEHDHAVEAWQAALQLAPGDPSTLYHLGQAHQALGQHEQALDCHAAAAEHWALNAASQGPDGVAHATRLAAARREAGRAALALEQPAVAAHHLAVAAQLLPTDAAVHHYLGQALRAGGQLAEALAAQRQAVALAPDESEYSAALAETLSDLGEDAEAVHIMQKIVQAGGQHSKAQQQLGQIALRAGYYAQAVEALRSALGARPSDSVLQHAYAVAVLAWGETLNRRARAGLPGNAAAPAAEIEKALEVLRILRAGQPAGIQPAAVLRDLGRAFLLRGWNSTSAGDLAAATDTLTASLAMASSAVAQRALGLVHLRAGRPGPGLAALESAVGLDPTDAISFLELGLAFAEQNRTDRAVAALGRAATLAPDDPLMRYHLSVALRAAGRHADANSALAIALGREPGAATWHAALAGGLRFAGDDMQALEHWRRAVELSPDVAEYHYELGLTLQATGDARTATHELEEAIHRVSDQAEWWRALGTLYLAQGLAPRAVQCYERAATLLPHDAHLQVEWATALIAKGERELAAQRLEGALKREPQMPKALAALGNLHASAGHPCEALACLQRAADLDRDESKASHLLAIARLQRQIGDRVQAEAALDAAVTADPECCDAHAELGDLLFTDRRYDEARQAYQQAVVLAPNNADHYVRLGRVCRATGNLDQALAHLQRACQLAPSCAPAYHEMGKVYEDRRELDRAIETYRQAIARLPGDGESYRLAGLAYKARKAYPEAVAMLRKAAELVPNDVELHKQVATVGALAFVHAQSQSNG